MTDNEIINQSLASDNTTLLIIALVMIAVFVIVNYLQSKKGESK